MVVSLLNLYIMKNIISVGFILEFEVINYVRKNRNIIICIIVDIINIIILIFKIFWCFCPVIRCEI